MDFDTVFESPVGRLGIRMQGAALGQLLFLSGRYRLRPPASPQAEQVVQAVLEYFDNPRHSPELAVQLTGTDFQLRVWQALRRIPSGSTLTYGALAQRLGSGARAVGNACRHNPVPIVVPCHRVVAQRGPGGFAGQRQGRLLDVKQRLLRHEGVEIPG